MDSQVTDSALSDYEEVMMRGGRPIEANTVYWERKADRLDALADEYERRREAGRRGVSIPVSIPDPGPLPPS